MKKFNNQYKSGNSSNFDDKMQQRDTQNRGDEDEDKDKDKDQDTKNKRMNDLRQYGGDQGARGSDLGRTENDHIA